MKTRVTTEGDIDLAIASETTELLPRQAVGKPELGIEMPQFDVRKLSAELTCHDRRPVLAGMFTPRRKALSDRRVMVFVTAFLRQPPAEEKEEEPEIIDNPFAEVPEGDGSGDPEEEPEEIEFGVQNGVEIVEIPRGEVANLLAAIPADFEDVCAARQHIDRLVEDGSAKVVAFANLTSAGHRARVQPVHEFLYPTEYDPPSVVQKLTAEVLAQKNQSLVTRSQPTAFDYRNLGLSVETESKVGRDGNIISIDLAADRVTHLRSTTWGIEESEAQMPILETTSCKTKLRLRCGEETIAAILTPRNDKDGSPSDNRCLVILLWADVAKSKPAANSR